MTIVHNNSHTQNMSNTSSTIQFLKENPSSNFIRLTDLATDKIIGPKQNIFLSDIPNEDLKAYLKFLLGDLTENIEVWIEHRSQKGATTVKVGTSYKLPVIAPKVQAVPEVLPATVPAVQTVAAPIAQAPPVDMFGSGNFGLNGGQLMGIMLKAERLEDSRKEYADLKEEFKDLKQDYRNLDNENRELKTKLSTSEAQKELAVMLAKNETKSFLDSPAFGSLMENAPAILQAFAASKGGAVSQAVMPGLAGPSFTDTQAQFVQHVVEKSTDDQLNFLITVHHYYMSNPDFAAALNALITTTHAGSN